jgi:hypothetical protein
MRHHRCSSNRNGAPRTIVDRSVDAIAADELVIRDTGLRPAVARPGDDRGMRELRHVTTTSSERNLLQTAFEVLTMKIVGDRVMACTMSQ